MSSLGLLIRPAPTMETVSSHRHPPFCTASCLDTSARMLQPPHRVLDAALLYRHRTQANAFMGAADLRSVLDYIDLQQHQQQPATNELSSATTPHG